MQQVFFSIRLRQYTTLGFIFSIVFFSFLMGAGAHDGCPKSDDHALSAVRYQLFTAYQTGYDGYQAPCEMKCFSNSNCIETCQTKKGMESLNKQLSKLLEKKNLSSCQSYSQVCVEQCKEKGEPCQKACQS